MGPTLTRFNGKWIEDENGCHVWQGYIGKHGYGKFKHKGLTWRAHRFAWMMYNGPINRHLVVDHLCRNRACVNPKHLELVTQKENVRRGDVFKGSETHCGHGHPWESNSRFSKRGYRYCLACAADRTSRWRQRQK